MRTEYRIYNPYWSLPAVFLCMFICMRQDELKLDFNLLNLSILELLICMT